MNANLKSQTALTAALTDTGQTALHAIRAEPVPAKMMARAMQLQASIVEKAARDAGSSWRIHDAVTIAMH